MKKLNPDAVKAILVIHLCCLALWLGGVLSCLPLLFNVDISDFDKTYTVYTHMRDIAWNVIGWDRIG